MVEPFGHLHCTAHGKERTQVIGNVESGRARIADLLKVGLTRLGRAGVHNLAAGEEHEFVKQSDDV